MSAQEDVRRPTAGSYVGVVEKCHADGPWGYIYHASGTRLWFHPASLLDGGPELAERESVSFDVRHHPARGMYEAVDIRRLPERADPVPVPEPPSEPGPAPEPVPDTGPEPPSEPAASDRDVFRGVVKQFSREKGFGFVTRDDGRDYWTDRRNVDGDPKAGDAVEFRLRFDERHRKEEAYEVRPVDRRVRRPTDRPALLRFADLGPEPEWLPALAAQAEPEDWAYRQNPGAGRRAVLRDYLFATFARLAEQEEGPDGRDRAIRFGDRDGRRYACFDTGLVTPGQEPLYALLGHQSTDRDGRAWRLEGFHAADERALRGAFERLPAPARYAEEPGDLVYDLRLDLVIDTDRLVGERLDAFPRPVKEALDPRAAARDRLRGARDRALRRVARDYRTAVPHYHRGRLGLLLPVSLRDPRAADLALSVVRDGDRYRGTALLSLDRAYLTARLLGRPDTGWLSP